jgi:hypothetical protein
MNLAVPPAPLPPSLSPAVPPRAARLSHAALLPFVLGAVLAWLVWPEVREYVLLGLSAYAGLALALLAGIHWGLAMRRPAGTGRQGGVHWAWPAGLTAGAWVALVMQPHAGLVLEGVLLGLSYLVDRRAYPAAGLSHWLTLRFRLSVVAAASCFLAAAGA